MVIQGVSPLKIPFNKSVPPHLTRFNGSPSQRENLPQTPYTSPAYAASENSPFTST